MKKVLCFILMIALTFSSITTAEAKEHKGGGHGHHNVRPNENTCEETEHEYKLDEYPVIKYGKYQIPLFVITKGMGATVTFDKNTAVLTVVKSTITIVIDFKNKTVMVNGVADSNSGIFTTKNKVKTNVLLKYIAKTLITKITIGGNDITVAPGLNAPTDIMITPIGSVVRTNSLNSTSTYMTVTARITQGQATGGRAELYVGSKLVATDNSIGAGDKYVTFSTSDNSPTNAELQAAVPVGGVVTIRLYNANNNCSVSSAANPTLVVDYIAPTVGSIYKADYEVVNGKLIITVANAGAIGDMIDVTKISLIDTALGRTYQLTNGSGIGSSGRVSSPNTLDISVSSYDKLGLTGFGSELYLSVATGSLLYDAAGNNSVSNVASQMIPVTVTNGLSAQTDINIGVVDKAGLSSFRTSTVFMNIYAGAFISDSAGNLANLASTITSIPVIVIK